MKFQEPDLRGHSLEELRTLAQKNETQQGQKGAKREEKVRNREAKIITNFPAHF